MKWFLFMPYMMYQFFRKRNKNDEDAYMNGVMIFSVYFIVYCFFLIPESLVYVSKIFSLISDVLYVPADSKLVKYITFGSFFIIFLITIRKKRLDNLNFDKIEYRIAYIITAVIIWSPWVLFAVIITRALILGPEEA